MRSFLLFVSENIMEEERFSKVWILGEIIQKLREKMTDMGDNNGENFSGG